MRLGFYYHIPVLQQAGSIFVPGYLGRFLDELAANLSELTLFMHAPNPAENAKFDYQVKGSNISLVLLPPRRSAPYRLLHSRKFTKIIKANLRSLDAFMLRGPSPLLPGLAFAARSLPTILLIVGDYLAAVDSQPQPGWRKALIRLMDWVNYIGQLKIARKSLVFVNSRVLFNQYKSKVKQLQETRTTTLTAKDFYLREDTCQSRPVHMLYTGRLDPAKGLLDMVMAVSMLVNMGEDVVLDLVGWPEEGSTILEKIDDLAQQKGVKDRIFYHGYKAVGPELFAYYKTADIYVLASQSSFEGFPRTIWEAMAHSLPVVATRVGSIPDFIEGIAELAEPNNPEDLANCISKLMHDQELRKKVYSVRFFFGKAEYSGNSGQSNGSQY